MPVPLSIQIAVAGEALIDLIQTPGGSYLPCPGGAPYNLCRALARQGVGTLYLNPLSRDRWGRELAATMEGDGVQLARPDPMQEVTSLAVVNLTPQGQPDYAFYREGVADRMVDAAGLTQACAQHAGLRLVCTGALALDARDAGIYLPWLRGQRAAGRCVVVDANLRPSVMPDLPAYRAHVREVLAQADVIKVSDEDLEHLAMPGANPLERARHLMGRAPHTHWLVLTLGGAGAWLLHREGGAYFAREAQPLAVVDTVGAGDSFLAGLLAHLLHQAQAASGASLGAFLAGLAGEPCRQALRHALASASLCVQQQGCVPPGWQAAQDWANAHPAQMSTSAG